MSGEAAFRPRVVWVDGVLEPSDRALLRVTDRGFQLGDGVFETIRVIGGEPLELELHASRLESSAEALAIRLPPELKPLLAGAIAALCRANGLDGHEQVAAVRVTATRGEMDSCALLPVAGLEATLVVQAWQVDPPPSDLLARGLRAILSSVRRDPEDPLIGVKTTSRAEFVFARLEAARRDADEAIFLTTDGRLAEATTASLFFLKAGELFTPALSCGILASTTRHWIITSGARKLGLEVRQGRFGPEQLLGADEAFLASSVAGILPLTCVDEHPIGSGRPGPRALELRALRESAGVHRPSQHPGGTARP